MLLTGRKKINGQSNFRFAVSFLILGAMDIGNSRKITQNKKQKPHM